MVITGIINSITEKISTAERTAIRHLSEQAIETEPSLTDRFLGAIDNIFEANGFEANGFLIKSRTLRDRGRNAPEHEFGPDFISVLNINISNYSLSKGFLVQAKLAGKEEINIIDKKPYPEVQVYFPSNKAKNNSRLLTQCEQMLNITPDSFVFVYSTFGIYVVPASTFASIKSTSSPQSVYSKTLERFYKDFLMSYIGDRRLNAYDDETLRRLSSQTFSNSAMLVDVSEVPKPNETPNRFSSIDL